MKHVAATDGRGEGDEDINRGGRAGGEGRAAGGREAGDRRWWRSAIWQLSAAA